MGAAIHLLVTLRLGDGENMPERFVHIVRSESVGLRLPMTPMTGWGSGDREGCGLS
jgi:hypothetical protein